MVRQNSNCIEVPPNSQESATMFSGYLGTFQNFFEKRNLDQIGNPDLESEILLKRSLFKPYAGLKYCCFSVVVVCSFHVG